MLTVEEALARILAQATVLPVERVSLLQAVGRVLAEDVYADIDVPPFANSAVDGYAVRAEDTTGASAQTPVMLQTLNDIVAGSVPLETIATGTAARIMTGAMLPPSADAVVMVEDTRRETIQSREHAAILEAARPGQHCRPAGQDVARGELVLPSGTWLRAAAIGMLATLGQATMDTVRPPRVAIVSTGDEVVDVVDGALPPPGKIRNSNLYALAALVQEAGATLHSLTHIPDDPIATEAALRRCAGLDGSENGGMGADVIVTAGGVSVGDRDYVKPTLEKSGTLDLWRVAMKPGKPLAFGRIGNALFFGLPGNPVSAYVTFELFARPALWKMAGRAESELARRTVPVKVMEAIAHTPGRREYVRALITQDGEGGFVARTTGDQESNRLRSLLAANALLVVPEESTGVRAGDVLQALLLD